MVLKFDVSIDERSQNKLLIRAVHNLEAITLFCVFLWCILLLSQMVLKFDVSIDERSQNKMLILQ